MDRNEETPISKYLASLEKRQAFLTPSPVPDSATIMRRINFEDDTFLEPSVLGGSESARPAFKRRRLSILGEMMDEENQSKKISDLERLLQQTQGELIESRAMNSRLEHQIIEIKRSNGERIVGYESSQNEMRSKMRDATDQVELLKDQLARLSKKEEEVRDKFHKQTETHCEKIGELEAKMRTFESENMELKTKFESGSLKQSDELRKITASLEETEMGAEKWVMETQLLRDQLELKEQQLQKYLVELKAAQAVITKYNELKARYDLPPSPGDSTDNLQVKLKHFENQYVKQQSENLRLMNAMEKMRDENKMLISSMKKEMLLEEQICTFEEEVKVLRSSLESKTAVEAEKASLHAELSSWKSIAFKLDPDCTNSTKFEAFIRQIQNQLLEARHETSSLKLTISDRERTITKVQSEINSLREQIKGLLAEKENQSQEMKKVSRRLTLITKDRDGLKALKESYELEYDGVISKPLQERINQLENTVAEYEVLVQEDPSQKKSCGECDKRIALISELRTEMTRLQREKAEAENQLANMSSVGTTDDGNTTGLKIVSFGLNPSSMTLETRLKEAAKEIEDLKEQINVLQNQTVAEGASGSKENDGKLSELEDRNKTLERKLEILSEAYDFETQQLQLIVNKLCGYHFTLVREPNVQIRLTSTYSQLPDETFIFQESPNGDMLLLESSILDNFRGDIDRFLLREGSIPGFLASVTITYVQNQNTQDPSQLPTSQESVQGPDETASTSISVHDPREVQVQVRRQRHPTTDEDDEDEEEEEDNEEHDEEDEDNEPDDDEEGDGQGDDEDEEHYDDEEEDEEDDEHDEEHDESEDDDDGPPGRPTHPPFRRGPGTSQRGPSFAPAPGGDDSDDSDVIMID